MRLDLFIFLPIFHYVQATLEQPELTFQQLYQFGLNSYKEGEWADCISFMKRALEDFDYYESEVNACTERCIKKLPGLSLQEAGELVYSQIANKHFASERALCHMRCRRERFTARRPEGSMRDIVHDFLERRPYNYLQLCYWRDGQVEKATKAAYTYLVANPTDEEAKENVQFYMDRPDFADHMLEDMERADYERMYISGVTAYDEEDYQKCVTHLDTSLEEFWKEEKKCRIGCRSRVDWKGIRSDSDIDVIIASMYKSVTSCEHHCQEKLSWINGHDFHNLVAQIFRYQHFCYFKLMRGQDAARAISNHLLLDDAPDMRWNKNHYMQMYAGRPEIFTPDKKVAEYARQRKLEEKYLDFIFDRFSYVNGEFKTEKSEDYATLDDVIMEDWTKDSFPYEAVSKILPDELCTELRKAALQLPSAHETAARAETESRITAIFPKAKISGLWCGGPRRAACERSVILSIDKDKCSQWLGTVHEGCAIVACE